MKLEEWSALAARVKNIEITDFTLGIMYGLSINWDRAKAKEKAEQQKEGKSA